MAKLADASGLSREVSEISKARLKGLVRDFGYFLKGKDGQDILAERNEKARRYQEVLRDAAKIDALSERETFNIFAELWAAQFAAGVRGDPEKTARAIVSNNGLDTTKAWLKSLVEQGERELSPESFYELLKGLKGVGTAMLSELLCLRFPDKYWIWNRQLDDAISKLEQYGVWKRKQTGGTEGRRYFALKEFLDHIRSAMREDQEISQTLGREPNYLDADAFIFWLSSGRRIWRMAPGEEAQWWDECLNSGCILIGWQEAAEKAPDGDFSKVESEEAMKDLFRKVFGKGKGFGGWSQVWNFVHKMKPGDIILAKKGTDEIVGVGVVTSDCIPPSSGEHPLGEGHGWRHARKVDWRIKESVKVNLNLGKQMLVQEQESNWEKIVEAYKRQHSIDVYEYLWGQPSETKLAQYFSAHGFHFTEEQIATFYAALKTKGFVILSGLSGTGKTKLAQLFAKLLCQCEECRKDESHETAKCEKCTHLFLSVRPDWRDGKALLGYYNPLTEGYESTPLLEFLLRAKKDYEDYKSNKKENAQPYFIILDEMNLSHVEYYFADFLSVLESGRDKQGLTNEPLRLYSPDIEKRQDIEQNQGIPPDLRLPPNLYIVGTVNIDETTYMFSPKVLDRAFTIEFREVDFDNYPPSVKGDHKQIDDKIRDVILEDLHNNGRFCAVAEDKEEIGKALEELGDTKQRLNELNRQLQPYDLHFAYRVLKEIALFVKHATKTDLPKAISRLNGEAALDYAVLMKVLPKFHGPRQKLERPLRYVVDWCLKEQNGRQPKGEQAEQQDEQTQNQQARQTQEQQGQESQQQQKLIERLEKVVGRHIKKDSKKDEKPLQPTLDDIAELLKNWESVKDEFRYPATAKKALQMLRQLYETGFASFAQ